MKSSDKPNLIKTPFAASGLKNTIPLNGIPSDPNASYSQGFTVLNMTPKVAGGAPPDGKDMNGILYDISAVSRWLQAGAPNVFNADFASSIGGYPKGAIIVADDLVTLYQNDVEDNVTNPNLGGAGWKILLGTAAKKDIGIGDDQVIIGSYFETIGNEFSGYYKFPNGFKLVWQVVPEITTGTQVTVAYNYPFSIESKFACASPIAIYASIGSNTTTMAVEENLKKDEITLYNWGTITAKARVFAFGI